MASTWAIRPQIWYFRLVPLAGGFVQGGLGFLPLNRWMTEAQRGRTARVNMGTGGLASLLPTRPPFVIGAG